MRKASSLIALPILLVVCAWNIVEAQAQTPSKKGLIYQPSVGSFWDPTVIYEGGKYYMYTMYGGDSVWLATSEDGVHWKDYGVVLKSEQFKNNRVWKQ